MNQRLHYLDAVRAFALILGIVFHASMSMMPVFIGWAVADISTSSIVANFVQVSHSFRMELFFLIAGFFSHMTLHKKGVQSFLKSRLVRIAIPFVVGWFILKPLVISAWIMGGESMRGEVNILNGLKAGFMTLSELPAGIFIGSHLWFLYYMILITGIVLSVRFIFGFHRGTKSRVTQGIDKVVSWTVRSKFSWLVLAVPTSICLWFMNIWGVETPDKSLAPHWPVLFVYGGFFLFGWILHRQEGLIDSFSRISLSRIAVCLIGIVATLLLTTKQGNSGHPQIVMYRAGFVFSYSVMMWSLVSLSIGLFKRFLDRPNKVVSYIADASYWLYLSHLPIVIWLQIIFAELPIHWSIKLIAISTLTIGISIVLYDLFVRSTFIGKTLNGRKKDRVLFKWRPFAQNKTQPELA